MKRTIQIELSVDPVKESIPELLYAVTKNIAEELTKVREKLKDERIKLPGDIVLSRETKEIIGKWSL